MKLKESQSYCIPTSLYHCFECLVRDPFSIYSLHRITNQQLLLLQVKMNFSSLYINFVHVTFVQIQVERKETVTAGESACWHYRTPCCQTQLSVLSNSNRWQGNRKDDMTLYSTRGESTRISMAFNGTESVKEQGTATSTAGLSVCWSEDVIGNDVGSLRDSLWPPIVSVTVDQAAITIICRGRRANSMFMTLACDTQLTFRVS